MPDQSSRPAVLTRSAFIARQPAHQRTFYEGLLADLPAHHVLTQRGIAWPARSHAATPRVLCSPFRVTALVRHHSSGDWSRLVELIDPDGNIVECVLPSGKLDGRPREAISILSDKGLLVYDDSALSTILQLIRIWPVTGRQILVDRVGWTAERDAFVLPSGHVIARAGTTVRYRLDGRPSGKEIGDLAIWQEGVATLAQGNTNLVCAIALGLSTPLMAFTELNTVIYHFYGRTSRGKTRTLRCGLSVWPKTDEKDKTWHATINGLEAEIARSNGLLLGLDELPQTASPDMGDIIYKLANGSGKGRSEKEGGPRARASWQTAVLSTGEYPVLDTLKRLGLTPTGGQVVRMLDIPVIGAHGVIDALHGHPDSDAFLRALDRAIARAAGPAGAAFVAQLMALGDPKEQIAAAVREQASRLLERFGLTPGDPDTAEIRRVLESFALVAVAGEWASAWGITGWPVGMAAEAVGTIAQRWLAERGRMPLDRREAVEKVRLHLAALEQDFIPLNAALAMPGGKPPGFSDDTWLYVLPGTLADLASKASEQKSRDELAHLIDALEKADYLVPGGEKSSKQIRLPPIGKERPRAYRIRRTIFAFRPDIDAPKAAPVAL